MKAQKHLVNLMKPLSMACSGTIIQFFIHDIFTYDFIITSN